MLAPSRMSLKADQPAHDERDVEVGSQGLDQAGLPAARGTDQEDAGLLNSHIVQVSVGDDRFGVVTVPSTNETI